MPGVTRACFGCASAHEICGTDRIDPAQRRGPRPAYAGLVVPGVERTDRDAGRRQRRRRRSRTTPMRVATQAESA
ncbi:hypothetical protein WG70_10170 [Burkholderia oklahomensis EO147]|nr:hypothetical protein WG70_10170 [Burkholderia oklahomensis EO147]KUY62110.1 hypothetical protein WG70_05270 [Burkholderia oklahomensis EO147]